MIIEFVTFYPLPLCLHRALSDCLLGDLSAIFLESTIVGKIFYLIEEGGSHQGTRNQNLQS